MARTGKDKRAGTAITAVLIALALTAAASGQDPAPPSPSPGSTVPAPYSKECQGGTAPIVTESPLPNVTAALQKRKTIRILAIGASAGRRAGGYTAQIEILLKQALHGIDVVMVNRGVSGELAANAEMRIKTEVALTGSDLVIWQVGANDALAYVPIEDLKTTVRDTVRWLKGHNVDVVLAGLQYVGQMAQDEHYKAVRELLRTIATQENVMIVRRYEAMQFIAKTATTGGGFVPDEFERTEAGYNCLAQYIASAITLGVFGKGMRAPGQQRPLPR